MSSVGERQVFRFSSWYGNIVLTIAMLIALGVTSAFLYATVYFALRRNSSQMAMGLAGVLFSGSFLGVLVYLGIQTQSRFILIQEGRIFLYTNPRAVKVSESLNDVSSLKTYLLRDSLSYEIRFTDGNRIRFGGDIPEAQTLVSLIEKATGKSF